MSKGTHKSLSERELREFYDNLPETSKKYLYENIGDMSLETLKAYFNGLMHGREQVIEIVNVYIRRVEAILHK
jgi:hypothetical protein